MRNWILVPLLLGSAGAWADVVWLNDNWQVVEREDQARYYLEAPLQEQEGRWPIRVYYRETGKPRYQGFLSGPTPGKDSPIGAYTFYHANGQASSTGQRDDQGEFEGITRFYDEAGILTNENRYQASEQHGLQKDFHPNGQLDRIYWVEQGKQTGVDAHYYKDGSLSDTHSLRNDQPHGEQRSYYDNGQLREVSHYVDGVKLGEVRRYYPDGQLAYQANYNAKGLDGVATAYHQDGSKEREDHMRNGERHGPYRYWYDNGQLMLDSHYRHDRRHGEIRHYDTEGRLTRVERYENGRERGRQETYHRGTEQLSQLEEFDSRNRLVKKQRFTENGDLLEEEVTRYDGKGQTLRITSRYDGEVLQWRRQRDEARDWELMEEFTPDGTLSGRDERIGYKRQGLYLHRGTLGWDGDAYEVRTQYRNGERHGPHVQRLLSGEVIEQGEYASNNKVGRWEYRDDYGHRINHFNAKGQLHGEQRQSMPDGQLKRLEHYRQDKYHGEYLEYDDQGRLVAKGAYRNNLRHGPWQVQEPYERRVMIWQGEYRDGEQVGDWVAHSAAGYITGRARYDDQGRAQGAFYTFADDGLLLEVERYQDGVRHGESVSYSGGKPYYRQMYEHGEPVVTSDGAEGQTEASDCKGSRTECLLFGS